jgi:predicted small lipoprotein YifL
MTPRFFIYIAVAVLLALPLQACGNKGPLYLPDSAPAGAEPADS